MAIIAVVVLLVGFGQRTASISDAARNVARQDDIASDAADPQYELEIVHRQFVGLAREFDSTEAKLGVIALAAVALLPVYFADPRTLSDRILEMCLVTAAIVAALGFMLFRGYDAFVPLELQRAYRAEGQLALRHFCDKIVSTYQVNRKAIRAKRIAAWTSMTLIAAVLGTVSILRMLY